MKKIVTGACALAVAAVMPAAAIGVVPTSADQKNAAKTCKALRSSAGAQNFTALYGGKKNAYGKCVSQQSKKNAAETQQAQSNAAKTCKAEQQQDAAAFATKYGTNKNGNNAYGKCVSQHAQQNEQQAAQQDQNKVNAAKTCKQQQSSDKAGFASKWGSKPNAFGKCVSATAKQQGGQQG